MDIGALILDPFDLRHLASLHQALVAAARERDLDPGKLYVAYAAHPRLGPRLVVHVHDDQDEAERDPVWFLSQFDDEEDELNGVLGAMVSGFLDELLGEEVPLSTAWTVMHAKGGTFCVFKSALHTAALASDIDVEFDDDAPLRRLAERLGIRDAGILRSKLERPDTGWMPITAAPPDAMLVAMERLLSGQSSSLEL